MTFVVTHCWIC